MAYEEKLGNHDQLFKRIEGETVDGYPAYAAATFSADASVNTAASVYTLITTGSYNYAISTAKQTTPAGYKGAYFLLDLYSLPASGTFQLFMDVFNPADSDYSAFAQMTIIPATGSVAAQRRYLLYPGAVDTNSLLTGLTQLPLPKEWRLRALTGGGSGSWGYGIGVQYVD